MVHSHLHRSVARRRSHAQIVGSCLLILLLATASAAYAACNATCQRDMARCMAVECPDANTAACRRRCKPAPIRTLAYVQSECRTDAAGSSVAQQSLRIRRGDREPVTVAEFGPVSLLDVCWAFAVNRSGLLSVLAGALQRLGVSPDGANVVFEINDESSPFVVPSLSPEQKGFFLVPADGSEPPRRLGNPSRDPPFILPTRPDQTFGPSYAPPMFFSPNGRFTAYTDIGPGPDGEDAIQIVVHDLVEKGRRQVTQLPFVPIGSELFPNFTTCCPRFIDNDTVLFLTSADAGGLNPEHDFAAFTVGIDGSKLTRLPAPLAGEGRKEVPSFGVAGPGANLVRYALPGTPKVPAQGQAYPITEVYLAQGGRSMQLTNFGLVDTFPGFVDPTGGRAFFLASADPRGENPNGNCQMFSINQFGRGVRQITHFGERGAVPVPGCFTTTFTRPGCGIGGFSYYRVILQDPVTKTVVFESSCDPVGANPRGGQIFAMRPDGSGLRQLTDALGLVVESDGTFRVELPGPFAYSAPLR